MRFMLILAIMAMFLVVGCGGDDAEEATDTPAEIESDKGGKPETPPGQEKKPEDKGRPEDPGKSSDKKGSDGG